MVGFVVHRLLALTFFWWGGAALATGGKHPMTANWGHFGGTRSGDDRTGRVNHSGRE